MFRVDENLRSLQAEAFRSMRTNIKYSAVEKQRNVILVTSAEAGDGKSTTAMNLAITYSQEDGKKVLLIDCDLRKPTIHKNFKLSNLKGLTEMVMNNGEGNGFAQKYSNSLDILTTGKIPPNPAEILGSSKMERTLMLLRKKYDYIIIDSPPVIPVADTLVLVPNVDGVLLVVRSNKSKGKLLVEAKKLLDSVRADIIGVTLTRVKMKGMEYYSNSY